ncbi:hypothetical protein LTR62_006448 [Meristemomyces frigidus]|uniref:DUF6590 domain-containing protein n=1 Tax=Meristemomyces frigidus TaxID=1508187 RepID=A0AAN7YIG7_9PEZI|nr:hypothetical protein LTR62_006448 [Meristemomyces frigidus]
MSYPNGYWQWDSSQRRYYHYDPVTRQRTWRPVQPASQSSASQPPRTAPVPVRRTSHDVRPNDAATSPHSGGSSLAGLETATNSLNVAARSPPAPYIQPSVEATNRPQQAHLIPVGQRGRTFTGASDARVGDRERLDHRFKVRESPGRFFRQGRVFQILFSEQAGPTSDNTTEITRDSRFGERFYMKPRKFVVIRGDDHACTVLGIFTYENQGVSKSGVRKADHAIIYTGRNVPEALEIERPRRREEGMRALPIRVDPSERDYSLSNLSRINFAKVYTVEHNVKAFDFGMVNEQSMHALMTQFELVFFRRPEVLVTAVPTNVAQPQQHFRPRADSAQAQTDASSSQRAPGPNNASGDNGTAQRVDRLARYFELREECSAIEGRQMLAVRIEALKDQGYDGRAAVDHMYQLVFARDFDN